MSAGKIAFRFAGFLLEFPLFASEREQSQHNSSIEYDRAVALVLR